jgi:large subunit ribosomal protein L10e|tara:strand:- start:141 stop:689 length:549 start_codon:yes stop_codon:yes gene_type:complete
MGKVRRARAYSKRKPIVNTRHSRRQQHSYIKAVPPQKIVKFNMGNAKAYESNKFDYKLTLSTQEDIQIRDLALEAVRQTLNKDLVKLFTTKNFFLRVNVFPHNILRNNRVYSGSSKGERVQTGMTKSFGSPEGRAATIKKGRPIFTVYFHDKKDIAKVRSYFKKAIPKLPCKTKLVVERVKK